MAIEKALVINAAQAVATAANPVYIEKALANLSVDLSGGLRVHIIASDVGGGGGSGGGTASSFAAAFPTSGTAIGVKNGANMVFLTADASNNLNVNVASFTGTATVSGSVSVSNFPGTQTVSGTVAVSNFPVTQPISGTIAATQSGTWTVQPGNTANTTAWKVDGSAVTQPISGSVSVSNFPASQAVTGTFFQATQPVSGTFFQVTQPVSGTVAATQSGTWTMQPGNTANTTAWKVDGSAVTQPVSGTFFQATQPISGTITANQGGTWTVQPGNTANTTAWKVDGSAVTQPVSGSVSVSNFPATQAVTQSGTWTVQPGNTANTTAWKVDGSAVTQPVSGTVTANQGTANTAANGWFIKQTDGTNTAPTMDVAARAGFVEVTDGTNTATVDATLKALKVAPRPFETIGVYSLNGNVAYTATTANGEILSFRWGDATRLCVLLRVRVQVVCTAFTTAGLVERQLIIQRANTVADTAGTAFVLTGNNNKRRTSFGTSLVSDVRIGGFLTAGTRTLDANPVASAIGWMAAIGNVIGTAGVPATLYDISSTDYPIVFAQNEGFLVRLGAAETASTRQTFVSIDWAEVNAF